MTVPRLWRFAVSAVGAAPTANTLRDREAPVTTGAVVSAGAAAAATGTVLLALAALPAASVTTSFAVAEPGAAYVCETDVPAAVAPSPKSQVIDATGPQTSV